MIYLTKQKLKQLLLGASILSTGGGGNLNTARKIISQIKSIPKLIDLNEFNANDLVVTTIGVGDKDVNDPIISSQNAMGIFQKLFKKKIKAIIPIEIGPVSTLTSVLIASRTKLPIVNSDIVGFRASPEIWLETISLGRLNREPIILTDGKKNTIVLYQSQSITATEVTLRNFAINCGGDAFGIGYSLTIKQIKNLVPETSISQTINLGKNLICLRQKRTSLNQFCRKNNLYFLGKTKIVQQNLQPKNGFIQGTYQLENGNKVIVKNENIALLNNSQPVLTVPDLLMLFDQKKLTGINNQDNNIGKKVIILGKKAIPIWRTKKGLKLFSPQTLGYNINQRLL